MYRPLYLFRNQEFEPGIIFSVDEGFHCWKSGKGMPIALLKMPLTQKRITQPLWMEDGFREYRKGFSNTQPDSNGKPRVRKEQIMKIDGLFLLKIIILSILLTTANSVWTQSSPQGAPYCGTKACFRSANYYYNNYKRLRLFPRDIFISGVNFSHPVDCVSQPKSILFALRGNPWSSSQSPITWFNQQYVAAQITQALIPLWTVVGVRKAQLACYGLTFDPVELSNGFVLTPMSTLDELFVQSELAGLAPASAERDMDMMALAGILSMLNSTC